MSRVDVILALHITRDRGDLVGLEHQLGLQRRDGLACLFRGALVRIPDRDKCCHKALLLSWLFAVSLGDHSLGTERGEWSAHRSGSLPVRRW